MKIRVPLFVLFLMAGLSFVQRLEAEQGGRARTGAAGAEAAEVADDSDVAGAPARAALGNGTGTADALELPSEAPLLVASGGHAAR